MRALLLLLALAVPAVLASPGFWMLVNMEFAVQPVTYVRHDGTVDHALLGPKAPWPGWVLTPEGARLTVRASFETAAPDLPRSGYGDLIMTGELRAAIEAYAAALKNADWRVDVYSVETPLAGAPSGRLIRCMVQATRQDPDWRTIELGLTLSPASHEAQILWFEGPRSRYSGHTIGSC